MFSTVFLPFQTPCGAWRTALAFAIALLAVNFFYTSKYNLQFFVLLFLFQLDFDFQMFFLFVGSALALPSAIGKKAFSLELPFFPPLGQATLQNEVRENRSFKRRHLETYLYSEHFSANFRTETSRDLF